MISKENMKKYEKKCEITRSMKEEAKGKGIYRSSGAVASRF